MSEIPWCKALAERLQRNLFNLVGTRRRATGAFTGGEFPPTRSRKLAQAPTGNISNSTAEQRRSNRRAGTTAGLNNMEEKKTRTKKKKKHHNPNAYGTEPTTPLIDLIA